MLICLQDCFESACNLLSDGMFQESNDTALRHRQTALQIKNEACMEDLNNLLNGGEVPNLFPPDERLQVSGGAGTLSEGQYTVALPYLIISNGGTALNPSLPIHASMRSLMSSLKTYFAWCDPETD